MFKEMDKVYATFVSQADDFIAKQKEIEYPMKSVNERMGKKVDSVQSKRKYLCGDASRDGSVKMTFQGGCNKEVDLEDSYRCTGCGGRFHLACIEEHFELECDKARVALKGIKGYYATKKAGNIIVGGDMDEIYVMKFVDQGLKRKSAEEKLKETITTT